VLNDAKAAALAEWNARPEDQNGNFMFVTVSTGIGSGLVLGGRLHEAPGGQDVGLGFTAGPDGGRVEGIAFRALEGERQLKQQA
jgi:predicted NBD/HSP70 family sugar kinase